MPPSLAGGPKATLVDGLKALKGLVPYLWPRDSLELRLRVVAALALLVAAKAVNIACRFSTSTRSTRSAANTASSSCR
jgi:hypothetical protein